MLVSHRPHVQLGGVRVSSPVGFLSSELSLCVGLLLCVCVLWRVSACWFAFHPIPSPQIYMRFLEYEMHNSNECKRNFVAIYDGSSGVEHLKNKFCSTVANDVMLVTSVGVVRLWADEGSRKSRFKILFTTFHEREWKSIRARGKKMHLRVVQLHFAFSLLLWWIKEITGMCSLTRCVFAEVNKLFPLVSMGLILDHVQKTKIFW